jgi:hypothetical protein
MRLRRAISGCLAALLVMGVVGVASAWASAPEVGRCLKVAAGTGKFSSGTCTAEKAKGSYEWTPTGGKLKFKTAGGVGTLETINGTAVGCNTEESGGEFNSPKTVTGIVVRFTGCHSSNFKCGTAGSAEGEIVTNPLEGRIGIEKRVFKEGKEVPKSNKIAFDLFPTPEDNGLYVTFNCGVSIHATVAGSVLVHIPVTNKMLFTETLKYAAKRGHQTPEHFEGEPNDVLIATFNEKKEEQSGITLISTMTGEELGELNTVF